MRRKPVAILVLVAAVLVVYRDLRSAYFFEDDFQWLAGTLTYDPLSVVDVLSRRHFYRPVIELYFWAATPVFEGSPVLFHLANVMLHASNGVLLYFLASRLFASNGFGFVAALLFVVLPGYVDAVAWVGALAEPVGAFFGCSSILALLSYRRSGRAADLGVSVAAFLFALLTHESSVVFLPLIVLADWAAEDARSLIPRTRAAWIDAGRVYGPHIIVAAIYVLPTVAVSQQSYLVGDEHYRAGLHAVRNALDYVVSLYVGKKNLASYVAIAIALALLLLRGTRMARFAAGWMVLALLPFVFFTWGNTSRYLYLPAMGFAMLVAEGIRWLDALLASRVSGRWRRVVVAVVVAALAVRFAVFATKAVRNFTAATQAYRAYGESVLRAHPAMAAGSVVFIDPDVDRALKQRYLEALVQWQYRDPTLKVRVRNH